MDTIFHFAAILGVDVGRQSRRNHGCGSEGHVFGRKTNRSQWCSENYLCIYKRRIYGHHAIQRSVTEEITIDPKTSYAMAKRFNEIYLAAVHEEKKGSMEFTLRFFNIYGARQDNRMVIPRFFEQALSNQPVTVYGNGHQTRDFTRVDDAIKSSLALAAKAEGLRF